MYLYLLLNLGAVWFPLIFSFHPRLNFYKEWKWFFPANMIVALFFIIWDAWFTKEGVWGFNSEYLLGWNIMGLPFEEILFFICIPYASLFTLHALKKIYPNFKLSVDVRYTLTIVLTTFCLICAFFFIHKMYTFSAFFMAAVSLIVAHFYLKEKLDHFYLMYMIILIPFFIINGILTGTGIPGEVVWYNESHIIGIRLLTIPFEDVFYGLTLLLMNVMVLQKVREVRGREK
ncbi:MAG: lycopene cyclase domain-containing protein [Saprospiraceae bacterium]|uniref:Lycopene cyclase domain-containing protein n=1 Tax=Candidatus Opimibacter skivensis TaxID=2982028 RepID=A0A9D7SXY7_9BACT|nr:lycopene cyclase domain-containing protein [Candidatus Opimibacter skivensis]